MKCPHDHVEMVNGICPKCKGGNWVNAKQAKWDEKQAKQVPAETPEGEAVATE
jgi:hypothetical protein